MDAEQMAKRTLLKLGIDKRDRAEKLLDFLRVTPASDTRRQRVNQLIALAAERKAAAHG